MNHCLFITIVIAIILSGFRPASAAVEPRLAGTWSQVDGAGQTITLSIEPGGRYSKALNGGKVIESGRLHMVDGNWMTSTDTGLSEKGTFSITGGKLVLRGGSKGTTHWVQASAAKQATALSATKAVKAEDVTRAVIPTAPAPAPVAAAVPLATRPKIASPGDSRNYRALSNNLNQMSQVARSFGHGNIRSGLSNLANLANQSNYAATTSSAGYAQTPASMPVPYYNDAASGRGSLSAKIKAQQAQQLSALPAAKVVQASPDSDESFTYGSRTLESKAFGPPKVIRIQVGAPPI